MSASILVGFATRTGSTQEVAEMIAATLRDAGLAVACQPIKEVRTLEGCTAVVLGAPLYMFRWHKDAMRFLSRHHQPLVARPAAVFALGPFHEDPKEFQDARPTRQGIAEVPLVCAGRHRDLRRHVRPGKAAFPHEPDTGPQTDAT